MLPAPVSAPTLEGIVAWTEEEILVHLRFLLPAGWDFTLDESGILEARLIEGGVVRWERQGVDRRILLLDAYGWLYHKVRTVPAHPLWSRQRDDFRVPIRSPSDGNSLPGDLDPEQIATVYADHIQPKRPK